MATVKSEQVTKIDSVSRDQLKPNEAHGRKRVAFFKYTTPSAGLADGDIIELCELPIGARVTGGRLAFEALGAGVVGKIGVVGADAKYMAAATSMAAIGSTVTIASTVALNYGVELTAKERLIMTLSGAAPAGSKIITGQIDYVVD